MSPPGRSARCAERRARRAKRTVGRSPNSRCQTAQCSSFPRRVVAPGFGLLLVAPASRDFATTRLRQASARKRAGRFQPPRRRIPSPRRGVDGAPTDALFLSVAPATRDHPVPGRPGPLSALHRGDFRMRTHEVGSRQWNRSRSDCPRQALMPGGRGPDLPTLRFAPQSWDATPRSVFQDRFWKTPPLSQDANHIL